MGKTYFIGIGISQYQYISKLPNAVKDVKDIFELLIEKYQFTNERSIFLFDEEATREKIILLFDELVQKTTEKDSILIYYSGHGHLNNKTKRGFWIPVNAKPNKSDQFIRNSTIRNYLEDIQSHHTLLISDSCFSGSIFVKGKIRSHHTMNELDSRKSRWAFCSGRHDEFVYDGPPGENSPFAKSILDVLKRNENKFLNTLKLVDEVTSLTSSKYRQLPEGNPIYDCGHEGGQFIFKDKKSNTIVSRPVQYGENPNIKNHEKRKLNPKDRTLIFVLSFVAIASLIYIFFPIEEPPIIDNPGNNQLTENEILIYNLIDERDDKHYQYFLAKDSNYWMMQNLAYDLNGHTYFPNNDESLVDSFGLLYNWNQAQIACPIGWRLPTDKEWRQFAFLHGGYEDFGGPEYNKSNHGYRNLIAGGKSKFEALLAGYRIESGEFYNYGTTGAYWTSTALDDIVNAEIGKGKYARVFEFDGSKKVISRSYDALGKANSCRCVKLK